MTYSIVPNDKLRALCIKNNWFTCGSNAQYEKLFEGNTNGFAPMEIATIIWLCSDGTQTRVAILTELKRARAEWTRAMLTPSPKCQTVRDAYLTQIEEAETMHELWDIRTRMCGDDALSNEDFTDCHNAFKLKRSELRGDVR